MELEPTLSQLGRWLFDSLTSWDLPIGRFVDELQSSMPHSGHLACTREKDVLPIPLKAAEAFLSNLELPDGELAWTLLLAVGVSYLHSRTDSNMKLNPEDPLSLAQEACLLNLNESARAFLSGDSPCLQFGALRDKLLTASEGYGGQAISICREMTAAQIIPTWPAIGSAAVQPVTKFLTGNLLAQVLQPIRGLRPQCDWPRPPRRGIVHATDEEWNQIVHAGWKRGIMYGIEKDKIFKDASGTPVLQGAMGVDQSRKVKRDGVEETIMLLRFISIMCPTNDFFGELSVDAYTLPYIGQLTFVNLEGDEE